MILCSVSEGEHSFGRREIGFPVLAACVFKVAREKTGTTTTVSIRKYRRTYFIVYLVLEYVDEPTQTHCYHMPPIRLHHDGIS